MIKVENKSKDEIAKIGRRIGEAFAAEKDGIVTMVTREQAVKAFEIITDYYYRAGVLYADPFLHMMKRFLCELPPKAWMAVAGSGIKRHSLRPGYRHSAEGKKIYPVRHGTVRQEETGT